MSDRPAILVSNDDGYLSEGLRALVGAMDGLGDVFVVAPEAEQSAASHAISLHRPLRIREVRANWYAVDGTPTDCAYIGINHVLKARRPALTVSGINHGPNLADDVVYSGTVAAAMEASMLGVPAIAFSLVTRERFEFGPAAGFARSLVKAALGQPLPPGMLLSVNLPPGEIAGYRVTRLGKHSYGFDVIENVDPRGRKYYWIGGNDYQFEDIPGTDCHAVLKEGLVSVTPLHMDLTREDLRPALRAWPVQGFRQA
jgi:5'-nucleotidase